MSFYFSTEYLTDRIYAKFDDFFVDASRIKEKKSLECTSVLSYFLGFCEFQKKSSCDHLDQTSNEHYNIFLESVRRVVSLTSDFTKDYYTSNFRRRFESKPLKARIGSNLFSTHSQGDYPKRPPESALLRIDDYGTLQIKNPDSCQLFYDNYIKNEEKSSLLFVWLNRFVAFESKNKDYVYNAMLQNLKDWYTSELVDAMKWGEEIKNAVCELLPSGDEEDNGCWSDNVGSVDFINSGIQKILFGAPGTGKSYRIDHTYGLKHVEMGRKFRVTFHPEYDYSQFVGSYKPITLKNANKEPLLSTDGKVQVYYDFVAQAFAKAYVESWKRWFTNDVKPQKQVYLVIEEINRGNCAQIFGDLFQLLDRDEYGFSRYPIDVDEDLGIYVQTCLKKANCWDGYNDEIKKHESGEGNADYKVLLPPNFNIFATMNTSDQSLYPMDSAFKRRFDWEYVPIVTDINELSDGADGWNADNFIIDMESNDEGEDDGLENPKWLAFLKEINKLICDITQSDEKQIGEFFVDPSDDVIGFDLFCSKVLFYLWDSVFKDYPDDVRNFFRIDGSFVRYSEIFEKKKEIRKKVAKLLDGLMNTHLADSIN